MTLTMFHFLSVRMDEELMAMHMHILGFWCENRLSDHFQTHTDEPLRVWTLSGLQRSLGADSNPINRVDMWAWTVRSISEGA